MNRTSAKKSMLQKFSLYVAYASFFASIFCLIYLFLKIDDLGWQHPISASLLASSFFFIFVGIVLLVIGKSNIPSFKVTSNSD